MRRDFEGHPQDIVIERLERVYRTHERIEMEIILVTLFPGMM